MGEQGPETSSAFTLLWLGLGCARVEEGGVGDELRSSWFTVTLQVVETAAQQQPAQAH